ncbi:DMT family transporter [Lihuaxuella thermophila]|uniref:Transporter family-2 protein n=1 Tax=Lihuaxuella thermophila TaxID=1173111 RepID=A0A1H8JNH9_9BACL|nr:transporter family-2 protein [Lihuaxuella thermophila]
MLLLALLAGVGVGLQAGVNGSLGKRVGTLEGALISFAVGTLALVLVNIFFGRGDILSVFSAPKWQLTGGLLGALYVFIMVLIVPRIGVAASLVGVIAGQLLISVIIDHFGWMGGRQIPVDANRLAGIALLAVALFFFFRK